MGTFWGAFAVPTAGAAARALSDGAEVTRAATAQTVGVLVLDRVDVPLWELYPETYGDITHVTLAEGVTEIPDNFFWGCASLVSVTIPSSVTRIGKSAFFGCGLTSVSIPAGVTAIGGGAFSGCGSLTSLVVAADNPNYTSTNGNLLTKDGRTLLRGVKGANGRGTIPAGVTEIGDEAFAGYGGLTSVTIPAGVTRIGTGRSATATVSSR